MHPENGEKMNLCRRLVKTLRMLSWSMATIQDHRSWLKKKDGNKPRSIFRKMCIRCVWAGCLPFFAIKICGLYLGHTPGQHTPCHNTRAALFFSNFHFSLSAYRQALGMEYFVVLLCGFGFTCIKVLIVEWSGRRVVAAATQAQILVKLTMAIDS